MSMFEAVRRLPGLFRDAPEESAEAKKVDVVDEYEHLVAMARAGGRLDRQSSTWNYVAGWAARELLQTRARQDAATTNDQAIALRERARILKELLSIDEKEQKKRIEVKGHAPEIP